MDIDALLAQALPERRTFAGVPTAEEVRTLPSTPAIFVFVDQHNTVIQLATTQQLRKLAETKLLDATRAQRGKADLAAITRSVWWRPIAHPFEARWWYFRLAKQLRPDEYRKLVAFGPAWFLQIDWSKQPPEIRVRNDVWKGEGEFIGPFPDHVSAGKALEGLWDVFDLCRHPEEFRRLPNGRRCAYADMGRCEAPCDGTTPPEAMIARIRAAWRFAGGQIDEWMVGAEIAMRSAAREQRFEQAALLKKQVEFARNWKLHWSRWARPSALMRYWLALRVTRRKAWIVMSFDRGEIRLGPMISDRQLATALPRALESIAAAPADAVDDEMRMEQSWLLTQLLFSRESDRCVIESADDPSVVARIIARIGQIRATAKPSDDAAMTEASSDSDATGSE